MQGAEVGLELDLILKPRLLTTRRFCLKKIRQNS